MSPGRYRQGVGGHAGICPLRIMVFSDFSDNCGTAGQLLTTLVEMTPETGTIGTTVG